MGISSLGNARRRQGAPHDDTIEPNLTNHGKIALEGLHNTRDLGGLPAGSGHVRPRLLLRSGMLAPATAEDLATLRNAYDVRLVIDLRTDEEAAHWPDPMGLLPEARLVRLPVFRARAAETRRRR